VVVVEGVAREDEVSDPAMGPEEAEATSVELDETGAVSVLLAVPLVIARNELNMSLRWFIKFHEAWSW
jgi:hypothetical protein